MSIELVDPQWDVFSPVAVDDSTEMYSLQSLKPLGSNLIGQNFGVQSPIEFFMTDSQRYINFSKSYIELAVKLVTNQAYTTPGGGTLYPANGPYAPNTPIAIEFDACRFFNRVECTYGDTQLESTSVYHDRTCMIRDLLQIDGAYASTRAQNAATITDLFLLDSPGNQLNTTISTQALNSTTTSVVTLNASAGGETYENTLVAGPPQALTLVVNGGGAYGIMGDNVVVTSTTQTVPNPLFNQGFSSRANLSDSGKTVYLRIPLSRIFGFCQLDRVMYGNNCMFRLYPQSQNNLIYHAYADSAGVTLPDGGLQIVGLDMMLAAVKPNLAVQAKISEQLIAKTSQELCWEFADTYSYNIGPGLGNINQIITSISERPSYVVFSFLPTPFINSQLYPAASSWAPATSTDGTTLLDLSLTNQNPFNQMYIQLGSKYYPQIYLGTLPGDNARYYQTLLDITGRQDPGAGLTPCIGYNDLFGPVKTSVVNGVTVQTGYGGYFMAIFDLRYIEMDATSVGSPQQLIFNANLNGKLFNANGVNLYCTVFTQRVGQVSAVDRSIVITKK